MGSFLQEPWQSLVIHERLKLNSQSYKQWPSLPFDSFQKAWKLVISSASKWTHLTLHVLSKLLLNVMLHIPLSNISCPRWPHLGISLYKQSLNGIAKRREGSRMNSAAGFAEGNGEQWRQCCLASLNSAILCAHPHPRKAVLLHKEGKHTLPVSTQLAAGSPAMPLVQDCALASRYNLRNIHPVPQPSSGTTSTSKNLIVVIARVSGHNPFYPGLLG